MKETLQTLLKLVEIDNKIDHILLEQQDIPTTNEQCQKEIAQLQRQLDDTKTEIQALEAKQKNLTSFLSEKKEWITTREERINEVSTQKEFQAAQKEITTAKKEIKDKEVELETVGPKLTSLQSELASLLEKNEPRIADLTKHIQENTEHFNKIDAVIDSEQKRRALVLAEMTDAQILAHYEIIHTRVSPAMAKADEGNCSECGTRILPQTLNRLSIGKEMFYCTRCKRILYLEEGLVGAR